ncbi:MAG: GNAT family N-acetyltransferase [Cyanobacteria bacterium SZAS-4]|nr:GNAT family N-acetyltransferase [Cyanobacteria bacterium SZAS-4]
MTIALAEWSDILTVLHETYDLWSPGLRKDEYQEYIWRQMNEPWARRNYKFFVLKKDAKVVCSCKLYTVSLSRKGKRYQIGGLGAIYTMKKARGNGYASEIIREVVEYCFNNSYDGTILFSDIDPLFYERLGFIEFGSADFGAHLPKNQLISEYEPHAVTYVEASDVPEMISIYAKWLRTQPFGFHRSELYLKYKLGRERYLADHSTLAWPRLEITYAEENGTKTGYALTERGGHNLRVLELVGSEQARRQLWSKLVENAIAQRMHKLRGWESVATDLFPGFRLEKILNDESTQGRTFAPLTYSQRTWGRPMFMPFLDELDDLFEYFPCPILELDHL